MTVAFVELLAPGAIWLRDSNNISGVRAARRLGHQVIVLVRRRDPRWADLDELVDRWIVCDTTDAAAVAAAVRGHPVDLLLSWIDPFAGVARAAAVLLGLAEVISAGTARALMNKATVRATLDEHDVPHCRWFTTAECPVTAKPPVPFPLVAKPIDGFASLDTRRVTDRAELGEALSRHRRRESYSDGIKPIGHLVCEEELRGPLVSTEGMVVDGTVEIWGHSDRTMGPPPYFVETSVAFAGDALHPGLAAYTQTVCDAVGYRIGPFHCEMILTSRGPVLIELNARLVGAGIHHGIDLATGGCCAEAVLRAYLKLPREPLAAHRAVCLYHRVAGSGGTVRRIAGRERAGAAHGVQDVVCRVRPGDAVSLSHSNADRLCYVLATGATRGHARDNAESAAGMVAIEWDESCLG